jgi:hypothetical protein
MCFSWSVSCFSFQFFFSFVCCNKSLDPNKFLLEKLPCFSFAKNTPFFTLIIPTSVLVFLLLLLVFIFRLDLCSDLLISLHQGVLWPLVHVGIHEKSCFKKFRMVLDDAW